MLWSTLERIPVEYREPMILFYREQKSVRAVAELLGLSEDAVKQRLRRGRAMVKEEIRTLVEEILFDNTAIRRFFCRSHGGFAGCQCDCQDKSAFGSENNDGESIR